MNLNKLEELEFVLNLHFKPLGWKFSLGYPANINAIQISGSCPISGGNEYYFTEYVGTSVIEEAQTVGKCTQLFTDVIDNAIRMAVKQYPNEFLKDGASKASLEVDKPKPSQHALQGYLYFDEVSIPDKSDLFGEKYAAGVGTGQSATGNYRPDPPQLNSIGDMYDMMEAAPKAKVKGKKVKAVNLDALKEAYKLSFEECEEAYFTSDPLLKELKKK